MTKQDVYSSYIKLRFYRKNGPMSIQVEKCFWVKKK